MRLLVPLALALFAPSAHAAAYYFTDAGRGAGGDLAPNLDRRR